LLTEVSPPIKANANQEDENKLIACQDLNSKWGRANKKNSSSKNGGQENAKTIGVLGEGMNA